ncbi:MAG: hypothetical protein ACXAC5_03105 [Promethearchaeota archaeon]|jgi:hypothetical protein
MNPVEEDIGHIVSAIVLHECGQDTGLMRRVLNRGRKTQEVVRIRRMILLRLRSEVWERGRSGMSCWRVVHQIQRPEGDWRPLSFPQIAKNLGGNHSSWVKMEQNIKQSTVEAGLAAGCT